VRQLSQAPILGFDTEWRPTYQKGKQAQLALIQLATHDSIFLLDVLALRCCLSASDWLSLGSQVFMNADVIKVGFECANDFSCLVELGILEEGCVPLNLIDMKVEQLLVRHVLQRDYLDTGDKSLKKGLSRLSKVCTGKVLDKARSVTMSNWEQRPLSSRQLHYAAVDAYILVLIYGHLTGLIQAVDGNLSLPLSTPPADLQNSFWCGLCTKHLDTGDAEPHYTSQGHVKRTESLADPTRQFHDVVCTVCSVHFGECRDGPSHYSSFVQQSSGFVLKDIWCSLCNKHFHPNVAQSHYDSKKHLAKGKAVTTASGSVLKRPAAAGEGGAADSPTPCKQRSENIDASSSTGV